jgi:hypothetical protein
MRSLWLRTIIVTFLAGCLHQPTADGRHSVGELASSMLGSSFIKKAVTEM